MAIIYHKRYRMEIELDGSMPPPVLPGPYRWVPWDDARLTEHAAVKYACFRAELDSTVFPCLGDASGCLRLMREIRRKSGFLPVATWLIAGPSGGIATIQGVIERGSVGSIQNVGVVPEARGLGLGRLLVRQALEGFHGAGGPSGHARSHGREPGGGPALSIARISPLEDPLQVSEPLIRS